MSAPLKNLFATILFVDFFANESEKNESRVWWRIGSHWLTAPYNYSLPTEPHDWGEFPRFPKPNGGFFLKLSVNR